ncbi:HEAT repeat domain-containing protein [Amycolatopsis sp. NPDC058278]|uniref:HEAT repeat domain-containing protein n=1 Tax=Amycolatopsis sp. NPDC058278 TaxID=3346417 RepID=UPI0036DF7140
MIVYEDARQWVEFEWAARRASWYRGERRLSRRPSREELAETACGRNGYSREAAVERLAVSTDPEALPLLLLRCVDWVRPVRELARSIVLSKLDDSTLRAMLPLIGILRRRQVDDWMTSLLREALPNLLDDALALEDRETRRWVHAEAIGLLSRERLLDIAVRDHDFVVRAMCGTVLLDRGECVEELLAAGAPKVRVRALTLLGPEAAVAHLADRSSAVRSMAQALVLKTGDDPAAHYRAMPVSFGALAGLGETGTAADAPLLERHLADERPRIRGVAVRGLRRIAPESPAVRPLLADPSPAVTRQAVTFLRGKFVDPASLQALLSSAHPIHTRRAAAALLRDRDTWRRLHTDLTLLRDPDLAADAHEDIRAWLEHSTATYTTPSPALAAEIDAACTTLTPDLARQIRFALPKLT